MTRFRLSLLFPIYIEFLQFFKIPHSFFSRILRVAIEQANLTFRGNLETLVPLELEDISENERSAKQFAVRSQFHGRVEHDDSRGNKEGTVSPVYKGFPLGETATVGPLCYPVNRMIMRLFDGIGRWAGRSPPGVILRQGSERVHMQVFECTDTLVEGGLTWPRRCLSHTQRERERETRA